MGISAAGYAALAGAGLNYVNTVNTQKQRDDEAAAALRRQGILQEKADTKVRQQVDKLASSNDKDASEKRQAQYLQALRKRRAAMESGLHPVIGSQTFRDDAADAGQQASQYADTTAQLMAEMDAPTIQRRQEGFDYGRLGTDLDLLQRESSGDAFINQLRQNAIRRNAGMDLASGVLSAYALNNADKPLPPVPPGGGGGIPGGSSGSNWGGGNSLTGGDYTGPGAVTVPSRVNVDNYLKAIRRNPYAGIGR